MNEQLTDQILVERVQDGDKKAFNLLVIRYQHKIAALLSSYIAPNDLPDVVQESFIKAYRALASFKRESAFCTWLYRIAVNTAQSYRVAQKRRPTCDYDITITDRATDTDKLKDIANPENLMLSEELAALISQTIDTLSEELRMTLTLRELEGLSYEEIAVIMDCPVGTIRSRIFRAREAINKKLQELL